MNELLPGFLLPNILKKVMSHHWYIMILNREKRMSEDLEKQHDKKVVTLIVNLDR